MRRYLVLLALLIGGLSAAWVTCVPAGDEELEARADGVAAEAPVFVADDLYYYDEHGMEIPLQVLPGVFVVHVRGGGKPDQIGPLVEELPQVESAEFLRERGLFVVRVKQSVLDLHYELQRRLDILLQHLNGLNAKLGPGGYAVPVARVHGKVVALSDAFFVQFKSFVRAEEAESFNIANRVEPLPDREAPDGAICLRLKPSVSLNILQMLHLYHEDPRIRMARPMFVPIFPPVSVRAELDVSATMLGDEVTYRLLVHRDANVDVDWGLLAKDTLPLFPEGATSEDIFITEARDLGPFEREGRVEEIREYSIVFYKVGKFVLPALTLYYRVGDDPRHLAAHGNPVELRVVSLLEGRFGDINSLPPNAGIGSVVPPARRSGLLMLVGVTLIAASGAGAVGLVLARRRRTADGEVGPEATAREEALRELESLPERIRAGSLPSGMEVADGPRAQVDAAIRRALEVTYRVSLSGGSTTRVLHELERLSVDQEAVALVDTVLSGYCAQRFLSAEERPHPAGADVDALAEQVAALSACLRSAAQRAVGGSPL